MALNKKRVAGSVLIACVVLAVLYGISVSMVKGSVTTYEMTPERLQTIYDYGVTNYEADDFDKAMRAFHIIVKEQSGGVMRQNALLKLGELYLDQGGRVEARTYLRQYIREYPAADTIADIQRMVDTITIALMFSGTPTEMSTMYEVRPNDTLSGIAKRFNTTVELIKKSNNLVGDIIIPGRKLKVTTAAFSILVDKSQNVLFLKNDGEIIKTYRVSTGENNSTPAGTFRIEEKLVSPVWYKVGAVVSPDSDEYELGTRWMGLSVEGYGIHGTRDPDTIGRQITRGCVRMVNEDVEELFAIVPSGTEVTIID